VLFVTAIGNAAIVHKWREGAGKNKGKCMQGTPQIPHWQSQERAAATISDAIRGEHFLC
jgi:hypothetical protein